MLAIAGAQPFGHWGQINPDHPGLIIVCLPGSALTGNWRQEFSWDSNQGTLGYETQLSSPAS